MRRRMSRWRRAGCGCYRAFGIDVRAMRATVGIGLREFAKDLGISAAYLCDLELGRRVWTEKIINLTLEQLNNQ
jgi:transcriptional regulator with XRE-family HTH domain